MYVCVIFYNPVMETIPYAPKAFYFHKKKNIFTIFLFIVTLLMLKCCVTWCNKFITVFNNVRQTE